VSGWEGDNTQRLIELVGGNINEDLQSLKQRSIDAHNLRFADYINSNDIVLDFGSGLGFGANTFADKVSQYICADVSSSMLMSTQQNTSEHSNIELKLISRNDLSALKDYKFTKIISHAVFVHLEIPEIIYYLKQFKNILADGGEVLFTYKNLDLLNVNDHLLTEHTERLMRNREFQTRSISYVSPTVIKNVAEQLDYKYVEVECDDFDRTARLINE